MHAFQDKAGRTWSLTLSVAAARRVRDRLGVDLLDGDLTKQLERIYADTALMCDVLFVIGDFNASPQERVSDEDFGRALAGDPIEKGAIALLEAIRDFIPNPRARARAGKLIDAILAQAQNAQALSDQVVDAALAGIALSGRASSNSPASPASSPGATRSASSRGKRKPRASPNGGGRPPSLR